MDSALLLTILMFGSLILCDVYSVVIEDGIGGELWGKTVHQRIEALIAIAQSDFRDEFWTFWKNNL